LREKVPITYNRLKAAGIDLAKQKIELCLVVQNFNGGVKIDENGFSSVPGLYAAGEVSGGVHGSDRPGGNNLIDTQVFGYRAGRAAVDFAVSTDHAYLSERDLDFIINHSNKEHDDVISIQAADIFYRKMTIIRDAQGLNDVLKFTKEFLGPTTGLVLKNRMILGQIFATAILNREESRGTHYRQDFPDTLASQQSRIVIFRSPDGQPSVFRESIN
jgi:aspartate oxidase